VLIAARQAYHDVQISLADGCEPQMKYRGKWGQKLMGTGTAAGTVRTAIPMCFGVVLLDGVVLVMARTAIETVPVD
jgi:hypothetical protein